MAGLDERQLALRDRTKVPRHYAAGQTIYREGAPASGVHCLRSGRVKASRATLRGRPHILRIQGPGTLLGLEDLFTPGSHSATAVALEDVVACFVERAAILEILESQPSVARAIARELAELARASEAERAGLAGGAVRARIARLLLRLGRDHGRRTDAGLLIELPLSREEIAEMAGTAFETAIRQLSAFRDEGALGGSGRALVITDEEKLIRAARGKFSAAG